MRKLFFYFALLTSVSTSVADNLYVEDVVVPFGGKTIVPIRYHFETEGLYGGYQFELSLPEGLAIELDGEGNPMFTTGDGLDENFMTFSSMDTETGNGIFSGFSVGKFIKNTDGTLISIPLVADETLETGTKLSGKIVKASFGGTDGETTVSVDDFTFTVTIGEPADTRIVLDENSTTVPEAATNVDVRVLRTFNADEWSTICLPFAMTEAQVKAAFGDGVKLGDFKGYEATEDDEENIVGITANFMEVAEMEANHPYIIKMSREVNEFSTEGVDIAPEDVPCVALGTTTGKGKNSVYHPMDFIGTYVADFDFYNDAQSKALFLSGNKFYYATENTKHMKAFRAYFDFDDVLTSVDEAASRISMDFVDITTGIQDNKRETKDNSYCYDLQGRRMESSMFNSQSSILKKGVYIVNGKKVINK